MANPDLESTSVSRNIKRKRDNDQSIASTSKWKKESIKNLYSTKLVEAIKHVYSTNPSPSLPPRSRTIRNAADRALAIAARGRTCWSRAILSAPSPSQKWHRRKVPTAPSKKLHKSSVNKARPIEKKAKVLSRLVPGCRKVPFPKLLEETTDYIAALEMQIRAMSALAQILACSGAVDRTRLV